MDAMSLTPDHPSRPALAHSPARDGHGPRRGEFVQGEVVEGEVLYDYNEYLHTQRDKHAHVMRYFGSPTPVTYLLIAVNVAVYIWTLAVSQSITGQWSMDTVPGFYFGANWPVAIVEEGQSWRLLSSVFLHGGLMHIGFNGYAIYVLGPMVERLNGGGRLLILSVAAGIAGSLASYFWSATPSVGFSGAVFGLVGALLGLSIKFRADLPDHLAVNIRRGMIQIAVLNLIIGLMVPVIDNAAHIGGFVAGWGVSMLMGARFNESERQARRSYIFALLLGVMSLAALFFMYQESGRCGGSVEAFNLCYAHYFSPR